MAQVVHGETLARELIAVRAANPGRRVTMIMAQGREVLGRRRGHGAEVDHGRNAGDGRPSSG